MRHALFLRVDHTAIVVSDADASLRFYRDFLGIQIAGTSENFGTEQEHLNNVFGARLQITTLRAARGPGIELLEYLVPRTGRVAPADTTANDGWQWQVVLRVDNLSFAAADVLRANGTTVSVEPVPLDGTARESKALLIRDPDGHADLLLQP